jgi:transcriptional regulator with XRE-family HTH domain
VDKKAIGARIKALRNSKQLSQDQLGVVLGVTKGGVSQFENGKILPSLEVLNKISAQFRVSFDFLLSGTNLQFEADKESGKETGKETGKNLALDKTKGTQIEQPVRPITVTVDHTLNEVITFVPTRAQAGYLIGYGDPEYIKELPSFGFPGFNNGTYRAFEVEGYSMLQYEGAGLYPKDIVIAEYVENPQNSIRDNRVYVVASDEGLLIKRCINRLESHGKLICNSDNKNGDYPPYILDAHEIKEVWEFKGKFSRQIPKATKVYEEIGDLQAKYTLMESEMKKTNQQLEMINRQLKISNALGGKKEE